MTLISLFSIFYNIHTFFQSHSYNTFIRRDSPGPLSISSSPVSSVGKTSMWCQAENSLNLAVMCLRKSGIRRTLTSVLDPDTLIPSPDPAF